MDYLMFLVEWIISVKVERNDFCVLIHQEIVLSLK